MVDRSELIKAMVYYRSLAWGLKDLVATAFKMDSLEPLENASMVEGDWRTAEGIYKQAEAEIATVRANFNRPQ